MPRLRISVFSSGLWKPRSSMAWKRCDHRARCMDLVAQRRNERGVGRDIDVHAGAEADEAEALAARKNVALASMAEYASRDESGNLYAGDIGAPGGAQPERVALVLQRRLVERGVQEAPGIVPALLHLAVHGRPVGVRIEDVHKYADLDRVALQVGIVGPFHRDDASVGRRDDRLRIARRRPRRVAKKLQHEKRREPERHRPPAPEPARGRRHEDRNGEKRPAFTGDDRVRVARAHCWLARRSATTVARRSIPARVDKLVLLDPGHHCPQFLPHDFDRMLGGHATAREQGRCAGAILQDEVLRVFARLDASERQAHRLLRFFRDDLRSRRVFTVLGVVRDRVVHGADAALVHQVDDKLEFMKALEIGHLWRVARLGKHFVTRFYELDAAAAKYRLLAEQVGFRLFLERGFDHTGTGPADRRRVGQSEITRPFALVAIHRYEHRRATALGGNRAHRMTGGLRRDHHDVEILARHDLAIVNVESMSKPERRALADIRFDVGLIHRGDVLVGHQHHDEVGVPYRFGNLLDVQAGFTCLVPGGAALAKAHGDFHSRVVQIERVGVPLRAVAHDSDPLALDERQVRVLVVIDFHALSFWFGGARAQTFKTLSPRPMPEAPVRTVSRIALCSSAWMKASSLAPVPVSSMVYVFSVTSIIRPRKISDMRFISSRSFPVARTLTSISSRSMWAASDRSTTLTTSTSLFSCFVICSTTSSDPVVTRVMRESDASSVGATVSVSML